MGLESRWASFIHPRPSDNGKRFKMGCCCLPLDRVNVAVNSKKDTKGRVKMDQGSRWVCVISLIESN